MNYPKINNRSKIRTATMAGELWLIVKCDGYNWPRYYKKIKTTSGFWRFMGGM